MGRKPNPLILEHFHRGPKLEDASNRYQHTCRHCGECFPKGRIDSLTNHLTKKCHSLSLEEKKKVLLKMHDLAGLNDEESASAIANGALAKGDTVNLPYTPRQQNFGGLEVLAEASRQVGASDQNRGQPFNGTVNAGGKTVVVDPALEANDLFARTLIAAAEDDGIQATSNQHTTTSTIPTSTSLPSIQYFPHGLSDSPSASPRLADLAIPENPYIARQTSQLSEIAASASEMLPQTVLPMEPDVALGNADLSGKLFDIQAPLMARPSATWPLQHGTLNDAGFFEGLAEQDMAMQAATQRAATFPRRIAINPDTRTPPGFVNDFGNSTKPAKPKVRGKFSDSRRKQVQDVRKMGACLRCRMLKKPCSGDTPCTTCQNVESARLWKQPCIRMKIADEFELYSAGLHSTLAFHDINRVKSRVQFEQYPGRIEVTHFEEPGIVITFSALEGHNTTTLDPQLPGLTNDGAYQAVVDLKLLDGENDDLPGKLEQYMKKMAPTFYEREQSNFMKPTLSLASKLSEEKNDLLLARALELWIATHILVDVEMRWLTFWNPSLQPAASPTNVSLSPESSTAMFGDRTPINTETNPDSYVLLCSQLRSAAEKRGADLSKSVMSDLERRLIQKEKGGSFETFLVAILLLNCVERTCWLFRSWENPLHGSRWPLDRQPKVFSEQGDRFSDIIKMISTVRKLPPETSPRPGDGMLKAVSDHDKDISGWYEKVQLTSEYLDQRQAAEFDPENSRSLDLKYCAKILQPLQCYT